MTRKEVVQNNVLIATFMGAKGDIIFTSTRISKFPNGKQYKDISLKYDKKWEWLMEVVEKIEKIYDEFHGYFFFFFGGGGPYHLKLLYNTRI